MGIIQFYPDELDYVNATLGSMRVHSDTFLAMFCRACLKADMENYELLRPALHRFMEKYPVKVERLARIADERHKRGV